MTAPAFFPTLTPDEIARRDLATLLDFRERRAWCAIELEQWDKQIARLEKKLGNYTRTAKPRGQ